MRLTAWNRELVCGCRDAPKRSRAPRKSTTSAAAAAATQSLQPSEGASSGASASSATAGEDNRSGGEGGAQRGRKDLGALDFSLETSESVEEPLLFSVPRLAPLQRQKRKEEAQPSFNSQVRHTLTAVS